MTIEEIKKAKYFRHKDEWSHLDEDNPLSCVYEIKRLDLDEGVVEAIELESFDQESVILPLSIFFDDEASPLVTEDIERVIEERERHAQEESSLYMERLCADWEKKEKERDSHFAMLKPPLKRGDKVILIGQYDRKAVDFSKMGDSFYVDDVYLDDGEFFYLLRVVAPRKNRGIYIFRTEKGLKGEFLQIDEAYKPEEDYDYRIKNKTLGIRSLKEMED